MRKEMDMFGNPKLYSEVDLFDSKTFYDKNGKETDIVLPHFGVVWDKDKWIFESKTTKKQYEWNDIVEPRGYFYATNVENIKKAMIYPVTGLFYSYWTKMALYYNSFEPFEKALMEYQGKPKGRDLYAEKEREKWFLKFKENF